MMDIQGIIQSPIVQLTAITLAHFVWQGAALGLLYLAACRLLRNAAPATRHALGVVVLLTMLACLPVTYAIVNAKNPTAISQASPIRPAAPVGQVVQHTSGEVKAPAKASPEIYQEKTEPTLTSPKPPAIEVLATSPLPHIPPSPEPSQLQQFDKILERLAPWVTSLYVTGLALMTLRLIFSIAGARRLRLSGQKITDPHMLEILRTQAERLSLKVTPALVACERTVTPVVIGVLKPVLLLPVSMITGLDESQLKAVFAHELAHLRRLDPFILLLQRLVETVLFFHPMMWLVSARVTLEREQACDDLAVSLGHCPLDYAQTLLHIAELAQLKNNPSPAMVNAMADKPSQLRLRVIRLLGGSPSPRSWASMRLSPGSACGVLGVLLVVGCCFAIPLGAEDHDAERYTDHATVTAMIDETALSPKVVFSNGVEVELLAVQNSSLPSLWWRPDGLPFDATGEEMEHESLDRNLAKGQYEKAFAMRLSVPKGVFVEPLGLDAPGTKSSVVSGGVFKEVGDRRVMTRFVSVAFESRELQVKTGLRFEDYSTFARVEKDGSSVIEGQELDLEFSAARDVEPSQGNRKGSEVRILMKQMSPETDASIVAVMNNGEKIQGNSHRYRSNDEGRSLSFGFWGLELAAIDYFEVKKFPIGIPVVFSNISHYRGAAAEVQVEVDLPSGMVKSKHKNAEPITAAVEEGATLPTVVFSNGVKVELVGIGDLSGEGEVWWRGNGEAADGLGAGLQEPGAFSSTHLAREDTEVAYQRMLAYRVIDPNKLIVMSHISMLKGAVTGRNYFSHLGLLLKYREAGYPKETKALELPVELTFAEWKTHYVMGPAEKGGWAGSLSGVSYSVVFSPAVDVVVPDSAPLQTEVRVTMTFDTYTPHHTLRVVAIGHDGQTYTCRTEDGPGINALRTKQLVFADLKVADIRSLELQAAPHHKVVFSDLALHAGQNSEVKIEVTSAKEEVAKAKRTKTLLTALKKKREGQESKEESKNSSNEVLLEMLRAQREKEAAKESDGAVRVNEYTLPSGVTVELLGLRNPIISAAQWWRPDGSIGEASLKNLSPQDHDWRQTKGAGARTVAVRLLAPNHKNRQVQFASPQAPTGGSSHMEWETGGPTYYETTFKPDAKTAELHVHVITGDWKTITTHKPGRQATHHDSNYLAIFSEAVDAISKSNANQTDVVLSISHNITEKFKRIVAFDHNGQLHESTGYHGLGSRDLSQAGVRFINLKLADIERFEIQYSPFDTATFGNIALFADQTKDESFHVDHEHDPLIAVEVIEPHAANQADLPPKKIESTPSTITFPNDVKLEIVAVRDLWAPGMNWWAPDGSAFEGDARKLKPDEKYKDRDEEQDGYAISRQTAIRVFAPEGIDLHVDIRTANANSSWQYNLDPDTKLFHLKSKYQKDRPLDDVKFRVAFEPWEMKARMAKGSGSVHFYDDDLEVIYDKAVEMPQRRHPESNEIRLTVSHNAKDRIFRVIAIDKAGKTHAARDHGSFYENGRPFMQSHIVIHDIALADVERFEFQTRPYQEVAINNVALHPSNAINEQAEIPLPKTKAKTSKEIAQLAAPPESVIESSAITFPNGVKLELVAVGDPKTRDGIGWRPDGSNYEEGIERLFPIGSITMFKSTTKKQIFWRDYGLVSSAPEGVEVSVKPFVPIMADQSRTRENSRNVHHLHVAYDRERVTEEVHAKIAFAPWKVLAKLQTSGASSAGQFKMIDGTPSDTYVSSLGSYEVLNPNENNQIVMPLSVTHNVNNANIRIVAIDKAGKTHIAESVSASDFTSLAGNTAFSSITRFKPFQQLAVLFTEISFAQIHHFEFQTRPYETVVFSGIAVHPGQKTTVRVAVVTEVEPEEVVKEWTEAERALGAKKMKITLLKQKRDYARELYDNQVLLAEAGRAGTYEGYWESLKKLIDVEVELAELEEDGPAVVVSYEKIIAEIQKIHVMVQGWAEAGRDSTGALPKWKLRLTEAKLKHDQAIQKYGMAIEKPASPKLDAQALKLLEMKRDHAQEKFDQMLMLLEAGREGSFEDQWEAVKALENAKADLAAAQGDGAAVIASYKKLIAEAYKAKRNAAQWVDSGRAPAGYLMEWDILCVEAELKHDAAVNQYHNAESKPEAPAADVQSQYDQSLQRLETKLKISQERFSSAHHDTLAIERELNTLKTHGPDILSTQTLKEWKLEQLEATLKEKQTMYGTWHPRSVAVEKEIAALKANNFAIFNTPINKLKNGLFGSFAEPLNQPMTLVTRWETIKQQAEAKVAYADAQNDADLAIATYRELLATTRQYYQVAIAVMNPSIESFAWMGRNQQVVNELSKRLKAKRLSMVGQLGVDHPQIAELDQEIKSVEAMRGC